MNNFFMNTLQSYNELQLTGDDDLRGTLQTVICDAAA